MAENSNQKPNFFKNFLNWFSLKPKLDKYNHKPPFVKEGQIWWCALGENIGTEISGKSQKFTRPVIIYTKLSKYTFLGIPTTTQLFDQNGNERNGSWYQKIAINHKKMLAVLSQIRIVDYRRLDKLLAEIDPKDFELIKTAFNSLYYKK
jgi:mRNA interferase MazF